MALFWIQLKTLLWRNFLLKKRNPKYLLQEILLPIMYICILAALRLGISPKNLPEIPHFPTYSEDDLRLKAIMPYPILVAPDEYLIRNIMDSVIAEIPSLTTSSYVMCANETEMASKLHTNSTLSIGIVFWSTRDSNYSYSIRTPIRKIASPERLFTNFLEKTCRNGNGLDGRNCDANTYLYTGFSMLQSAIDVVLIRLLKNDSSIPRPKIQVQMMPQPPFVADTSYILIISSIYFVLAYSPFISFLTVSLMVEKEKKIKEGMLMMGMKESVFWLSWGILYSFIIGFVTIIVVIIAYASKYFINSNMFILFLLLFLYGLSMICASFALTPLFKTSRSAGGVAGVATGVLSLLYLSVSLTRKMTPSGLEYAVSPGAQWALCLLSPVALSLAIDRGLYMDISGEGMHFSTLSNGEFPLYAPLLMLVIDIFLYGLLAVYLDNVIPGEYGPHQKPWYFLLPSYWSMASAKLKPSLKIKDEAQTADDSLLEDVEKVPPEMQAGLRIKNISKIFKNKEKKEVRAVDGLTLDVYEDQITALLGHNGAGKTTLINMLTGTIYPNEGTAIIKGFDISDSAAVNHIRMMTGVCLQENILFDLLTCKEHLQIFGGLKGFSGTTLQKMVKEALDNLNLKEQEDTFAKLVSGGQKRKLSVAIALIGYPKIIFLDEPTAGMDPLSRRHLWSLLKKSKNGRIILLTTHFMDEADILADRKAIICKGKLRCCGSSLFLKNRFGIGYHLHMDVEPSCDHEKVTSVLAECVSGVELSRYHGSELAYTVPLTNVNNFAAMFAALEEKDGKMTKAAALGIRNYGISLTTLEEVFLKIGEEEEETACDARKAGKAAADNTERAVGGVFHISQPYNNVTADFIPGQLDSRTTLSIMDTQDSARFQQFRMLSKIRFLYTIRSKSAVFFQLFLPTVFLVIGLLINKYGSKAEPAKELLLDLSRYSNYVRSETPIVAYNSAGGKTAETLINNLSRNFTVDKPNKTVNLLSIAPHNLGFDLKYLEDANFSKFLNLSYVVIYNSTAIHSLPMMVNLISNSLVGIRENRSDAVFEKVISISSWPWISLHSTLKFSQSTFSAIILIGLSFIFIASGFAVSIVVEKETHIRSQLRVSGVSQQVYWTSFLVVDLGKFLIPTILIIIIALAFQVEALLPPGAILSFILLCLLSCPCSLLSSYVFSFAFSSYETCQSVMPPLFVMISMLPYFAVSTLDLTQLSDIAAIIHYVSCVVVPTYPIFGGLYYIFRVQQISQFLPTKSELTVGSYFEWDNLITYTLIVCVLHTVYLTWLLKVLDIWTTSHSISFACSCGKKVMDVPESNPYTVEGEDEDVAAERARVEQLLSNESSGLRENSTQLPVAVIRNLRKEFVTKGKSVYKGFKKIKLSNKAKVAVKNVAFCVNGGEVFGLLGPNGAGKTSTLNMMITEIIPTRGQVFINGKNITTATNELFQNFSYCPQHNALWESITTMEHLECYAAIRGLPKTSWKEMTTHFLDNLDILEHQNKWAKELSGGTKRKLSYAMSMLGNPKMVLLDEPSTGMDPKSKRFMWDVITTSFRSQDRGAILTTHYMEEADILCSRIAIMISGNIVCLGSTQHLKAKFGSGYMLEVKLAGPQESVEERMASFEEYIKEFFPEIVCQEMFMERRQYKIPTGNVKFLSTAFQALEAGREKFEIEEYNFSQSSLEQVFLEFAKKQNDDENCSMEAATVTEFS